MNASDLVQELGQRLHLTGLTLTDGICRLVFDGSLPIDLEEDHAGNLCFHTVLRPLPHEGREAFLSALLSAHLFGLETDGAVFGLHPQTQELYLFRSIPVDALSVETALDALERFTQQAENWRRRIDLIGRDSSTGAGAFAPPSELLRA